MEFIGANAGHETASRRKAAFAVLYSIAEGASDIIRETPKYI